MRVFFKSGSTVSEITKKVNRYKEEAYAMTMTTSDYLYLSTDFPMNHFFIKLGSVVNLITTDIDIEYWDGREWKSTVHINDYTEAFKQTGFIEFTPDRDFSWAMDDTNGKGSNDITGLESITVYDQFWIRISVNANLTSAIELEYIGNLFSDDSDLYAEFPIFNSSEFLECFETGKTTWEEQHVKAADLIIQDMIRRNIIISPEQILDRNILMPASVQKVAEIIFNAFGKDYVDQLERARNEFRLRMDLSKFVIDDNSNGIKDAKEMGVNQGWLSR